MKKKIQDIEDLFKSAIDGHQEMPPGEVWNSLDAALEKSNANHKRLKHLKRWSLLLLLPLAFVVFLITQPGQKEGSINRSEEKTGSASEINSAAHENEQKSVYSKNKATNPKKAKTASAIAEKEITPGSRLKIAQGEGESNRSFSQAKKEAEKIDNLASESKSATKPGVGVPKSNDVNVLPDINGLNKISTSKRSLGRQTATASNDKQKIALKVKANSEISPNAAETNDLSKNKSLSAGSERVSLPAANKQKERYASVDTLPYHAFYKPDLASTSSVAGVGNDSNNNGKAVTGQIINPANKKVTKPTYFERKGHLSLTIFYSPNFNFSIVKSHMPVEKEDDKDRIKQKEQYSFSSAIGVLGDYDISSRWVLQTGLALSNTIIEIGPHTIYARQDRRTNGSAGSAAIKYRINSSAGFAYLPSKISTTLVTGDSIRATKSSNVLQYASVLIGVQNRMTKGKISFAPTAGLWMNFLSKQKFETTLEKGTLKESIIVKRMEGIRPVYFSAMAGCSLEYNVGKRIDLNFTPVAHIGLSSITKDGPVKTYQNSLSLMTGVRLKF